MVEKKIEEKEEKKVEKVENKVEKKPQPKEEKKAIDVKIKKEEKTKTKKTPEEIAAELEGLEILKYPLITEKAVNMIEAQNKLMFIVHESATKETVKKSIENLYKVKVSSVNMMNDMKARKKAIVQ